MASRTKQGKVTVSPPSSVAELKQMYEAVKTDPEAVAGLYVMAMLVFTRDPDLGSEMVGLLMTPDHLVRGRGGEKVLCRSIVYHLGRLEDNPHLARSYLAGTRPEDGYALPNPPYAVHLETTPEQHGRIRLFLHCSGAQSARPIVLQKLEDGGWRVREESSLYAGVIPPAK